MQLRTDPSTHRHLMHLAFLLSVPSVCKDAVGGTTLGTVLMPQASNPTHRPTISDLPRMGSRGFGSRMRKGIQVCKARSHGAEQGGVTYILSLGHEVVWVGASLGGWQVITRQMGL